MEGDQYSFQSYGGVEASVFFRENVVPGFSWDAQEVRNWLNPLRAGERTPETPVESQESYTGKERQVVRYRVVA